MQAVIVNNITFSTFPETFPELFFSIMFIVSRQNSLLIPIYHRYMKRYPKHSKQNIISKRFSPSFFVLWKDILLTVKSGMALMHSVIMKKTKQKSSLASVRMVLYGIFFS